MVSPILSNYLDTFDTSVAHVLIPEYTRGTERRFTPEYERRRAQAKRRKRAGTRKEARTLLTQVQRAHVIRNELQTSKRKAVDETSRKRWMRKGRGN